MSTIERTCCDRCGAVNNLVRGDVGAYDGNMICVPCFARYRGQLQGERSAALWAVARAIRFVVDFELCPSNLHIEDVVNNACTDAYDWLYDREFINSSATVDSFTAVALARIREEVRAACWMWDCTDEQIAYVRTVMLDPANYVRSEYGDRTVDCYDFVFHAAEMAA